jgi:peroxiredoxin Q/BCP
MMLNEGDMAPDFRLQADDGNEVSLGDFRGRDVIVYFYPKANTPGCTSEAGEFRDLKRDFDKLGVFIMGCSADPVVVLARFKAKYKLNFALLSDPDFTMIEAYGARRMKSFLGKTFLGIVRSTVWIGPNGRIKKVWGTVRAKGHAGDVLATVSAAR